MALLWPPLNLGRLIIPDLLLTPGVGARTVRSLAMVAEVVSGTPYRFRKTLLAFRSRMAARTDNPYPVPLKVYAETIRLCPEIGRSRVPSFRPRGRNRRTQTRLDVQARRLEGMAKKGRP